MTTSSTSASTSLRIGIIGAGFGGLAMAIKAIEAGHDVTVFEQSNEVGGTWSANTYPGAECDIPSALYSYSFAPYAEWPNKWSHQPVILEYLRHCADSFGVTPRIRFATTVTGGHWDGTGWEITWRSPEAESETERVDVLVSATGQLSRPRIPDIEGVDSFEGPRFHSARWDHDVDLLGKRVAVIGNAASATQFVPEIARDAVAVTVFQRSANWMIAKNDKDYSQRWKRLLRRFPVLGKVPRSWIWARADFLLFPLMKRSTRLRAVAEKKAIAELHEAITDPDLRSALTPDYPMGARRILFSDTYYPAIAEHDHLDLVTAPIERITPNGIVTGEAEYEADVVILATGFETGDYLTPIAITTVGGRSLNDDWSEHGAEAYFGTAVAGYPNLFFLYGPNTNLGHSSIVFMMECQVRLILGMLAAADGRTVEVTAAAQQRYNREIQERLAASIWGSVEESWYLTDGKITQNWPGRTIEFWRRTRRPDLDDLRFGDI